jgi:molybdopterin-binding protein
MSAPAIRRDGGAAMRISARNVIMGRIVEVEELRLATGDPASAVIEASDVMVGKD